MKHHTASRPLQKMFMAVPPSYDRLNRLLTLRIDELWRSKAAKSVLSNSPAKVLDLCTGTGDLALRLRKYASPQTQISALDYSAPMLAVAKDKASKRKREAIDFRQGDAASMPFDDGFFDAVGIAFAFRNLTYKNPDREVFLKEILRVLRPNGKFVAVETSQPGNKGLRKLFHLYMRWVTQPIGGLLSGHQGAYRYLAHSAIDYYHPRELKQILLDAGFSSVNYTPLAGGMAALWECRK